jgi:GT2 family glycosyltransferase
MSSAPRVSVLILNYNGSEHLRSCLPTVAAQVYPRDRLSVEVIDNGSSDGSVDLVRSQFPGLAVHALGRNLGFAPAYDEVARKSNADFLVFLNNDTRVETTWLHHLVDAAERHQAHCVASRILDWDGQHIDFVGGLTTFIGHTWQRFYGEPIAEHDLPEVPLLFACGGSMLISREAYIDAGGFDRDFFAYFEDVDLGWRLSLLGYRTVLAPRAVTYHRLHGTAGRFAFAQRLRLYERNALAMIYKNYEDESLRRVLPTAVALSLLRGLACSGLDPATFDFGAPLTDHIDLPARTVVHLLALEDFARQLPSLSRKRASIQARRRVTDRELSPLFGEAPFRAHEVGRYEEVLRALVHDFAIDELFGARPDTVAVPVTIPEVGVAIAPTPAGDDPPMVSIIILTLLGPKYLPDCLASLRALTYPASRREVIVVDNASAEDPRAVIEQYYPGARVIRNERNVGFAVGNNVGARAARGEFLIFLNDDTRVHPEWVSELVATAQRRGAAAVGSRILSWDGARIDFADGAINFEGRGFQLDFGHPEAGRHLEEKPLFFANGAGALIRRNVFLATGGWDEGTFAYYEDVELGWRLWLLGYEVWSSPRSVVYHRHNGTSGAWPTPPRMRLFERNAPRMLYTLLERDTLARVLPATLLLACDRALLSSDVSRAATGGGEPTWRGLSEIAASAKGALRAAGASRHRSLLDNARHVGVGGLFGAARQVARDTLAPAGTARRDDYGLERGGTGAALDGRSEPFPSSAAAALEGVREFLESLPDLSARRAAFQAARRRTDAEILARFGSHWLTPIGAPHQREHEALHATLVTVLAIDEVTALRKAAR